jgi:hypothetical protein
MAVVVDPGRLDLHHRGDEGREEHGFEVKAIEHDAIVPELREDWAKPSVTNLDDMKRFLGNRRAGAVAFRL